MEKKELKVLLVGTVPPPIGGDATWMLEYLKYCDKIDYHTYLVKTNLTGKRAKTTDDSCNIFDEIKRCLRIWKDLYVGIKRFRPNIVHLNSNCSGRGIYRDYICALIVLASKIPYVVHCHCNVQDQLGDKRGSVKCFERLCAKAKNILVLNSSSKEYVNGIVNKKIDIVPNYIDRTLVIEKKNVGDTIKRVVYVGHIKKAKGVCEIFELARKHADIEFLLVGPITEEFTIDEMLSNSVGNLKIEGPKTSEEVRTYLDEADIFLFLSHTEGFSLALLEAMSRGIPVIATDVGANKDMIEEKGGCIVKVGDLLGVEEAFKCMANESIRKEMSVWNLQKVNDCYTIDQVIENIWDIYLEVLNEKNI